jgi:hypothetical protein
MKKRKCSQLNNACPTAEAHYVTLHPSRSLAIGKDKASKPANASGDHSYNMQFAQDSGFMEISRPVQNENNASNFPQVSLVCSSMVAGNY